MTTEKKIADMTPEEIASLDTYLDEDVTDHPAMVSNESGYIDRDEADKHWDKKAKSVKEDWSNHVI